MFVECIHVCHSVCVFFSVKRRKPASRTSKFTIIVIIIMTMLRCFLMNHASEMIAMMKAILHDISFTLSTVKRSLELEVMRPI